MKNFNLKKKKKNAFENWRVLGCAINPQSMLIVVIAVKCKENSFIGECNARRKVFRMIMKDVNNAHERVKRN